MTAKESSTTELEREKNLIPKEIDEHFRTFLKEPWEVYYGENCAVCKSRIDEYGLCACDTTGGDQDELCQ